MREFTQHYIDGEFVESKGKETLDLVNPINKEVIGKVTLGSRDDTRDAIKAAKSAFPSWSKTSLSERKVCLKRIYDSIIERKEDHVAAIMEEYAGRTLTGAKVSVESAANSYLTTIKMVDKVPFSTKYGDAEVALRPLGVAGLITPWNADLFNMAIKIAPAIAAGCTVVAKPSELSAYQTQIFLECIDEAEIPPGVINIVNGTGDVVGHELSVHPDIAKISFTGSTAVGKKVLGCGIETMKRVTLELGGKSAHIILDDADLDKAVMFALQAAFMNNGQACIAGSRLLIPESQAEEIMERLKSCVEKFKVGDPNDPETLIGPLVSKKQYDRVQSYIKKGISEGATLLVGGPGHPEGWDSGYFVKPTIFVDVKNEMTIAQEEIFGPVLSVITYKSDEEAISLANGTNYGLFAWISGSDLARAKNVAAQLEAGGVMFNEFKNVSIYPEIPAGGFKQSGIGRELGVHGIEEYLQTQSIYG